jgi:alkylhydroperoxidase/carboxymuconolactone decarboxylase family protein YurZ
MVTADDVLWEEFSANEGEMLPVWGELRARCPEFFAAYANLAAVPWRRGALDARTRALVMLAINAAVTHLNRDEMRRHIRGALRHNAKPEEILEVLQLVSVLGIHAISIGFPALKDVVTAAGRSDELPGPTLDERQARLKEKFQATRGYWSPFWEEALQLDPSLFEAYLDFSGIPWTHGVLEPKVREFIYVAIDASTTHMFDVGTRGHMANALNHGATVAEILEVLELAAGIGIQSIVEGLPILQEEVAAHRAAAGGAQHEPTRTTDAGRTSASVPPTSGAE